LSAAPKRSFSEVNDWLLGQAEAVCRHLLPGGRRMGGEYVCGDLGGGRGRSMSVNLAEGVWQDFAGGEAGADLINLWAATRGLSQVDAKHEAESWLGLAASTPHSERAEPDHLWYRRVKPEARWQYVRADGSLYVEVARYRHPTQPNVKAIRPWNDATRLYEWPDGVRPLLYLPELLARRAERVILVEGEKCADAVRELGYLATTVAGGAQAIGQADLTPLAGRTVILWQDGDAAGAKWRERVLEALATVRPAAVHAVRIPAGKPPKWDAADAERGEREQLIETAERVAMPMVEPTGALRCLSPLELDALPDREPLIKNILYRGTLNFITGEPGQHKSFLAIDQAMHLALGRRWAGCKVREPVDVLYIAAEGATGLKHRLRAWNRHHMPESAPRLVVITETPQFAHQGAERLRITLDELAGRGFHPGALYIDTLAATSAGLDESSGRDMGPVIGSLIAIAQDYAAAVVVVHHMGKDKSRGMRGWSGINGAADGVFEVEQSTKGSAGTIWATSKLRDGIKPAPLVFRSTAIEVGTDLDGEAITSLAFDHDANAAMNFAPGPRDARSKATSIERAEHEEALKQRIELFKRVVSKNPAGSMAIAEDMTRALGLDPGDGEDGSAAKRSYQSWLSNVQRGKSAPELKAYQVDSSPVAWMIEPPKV
jgi:5S rRNA maturation endonuclease (ribonuclease M5)